MKVRPFLTVAGLLGAALTFASPATAQETCYVSMAIGTSKTTTEGRKADGQIDRGRNIPLVVFHADIFDTPCPTSGGAEPVKQEIQVLFFEAIKAKYPEIAGQIHGAWLGTIIFTPTRDRVFNGHAWWEPQGQYDNSHANHSIYNLDDFSYQPGAWRNSPQKDERYQAYFKSLRGNKYVAPRR